MVRLSIILQVAAVFIAGLARTSCAEEGNCVAGGSGYGLSFDSSLGTDTVGLHWTDIPNTQHTVEYWYKLTDVHLNSQHIISYSAYNVKGYLDSGGNPYESANELFFVYTPFELVLWKGTTRTQITSSTNPRVTDLWNDEWHHLAYTLRTSPDPLIQFFLDGEQLDFGSTLLQIEMENSTNPVSYQKAPFSNDWDLAENPDAEAYYARDHPVRLVVLETPPCGRLTHVDVNFDRDSVLVVTLAAHQLQECSLLQQAQNAAQAGYYAVLFEQDPNQEEESSLWDSHAQDATDDTNSTTIPDKLSIPVLAVAPLDDWSKAIRMLWTRTKDPLPDSYPSDIVDPLEPDGVLALGQEPDRPWGDFDPTQAANGCLDELRIWSSVRTPQQIKDNFKLGINTNANETTDDVKDLHIYWNFNDPPQGAMALTTDSSPNGTHPGLVGNLPTVDNQITFSDGSPPMAPSAPLRLPTQACPLVAQGQEVVVPITVGGTTLFELKSFDPDSDDLLTTILSLPSQGSLLSYQANNDDLDSGRLLQVGDIVLDSNRTENKRVVYKAPNDFNTSITFTYQVQDGGPESDTASVATVRLIPHIVEDPVSQNATILEDTLSFFALARPSQVTSGNMKVQITKLPERGTLYQSQFQPDLIPLYTSIAVSKDQYGPMEAITEEGDFVSNDRGLIFFLPELDGASASPDDIYAQIGYKFVDEPSGLSSATEGFLGIFVQTTNDPPQSQEGSITTQADASSITITLSSTDVDADSAESFATRPYSRITTYPLLGKLYQYDDSSPDGLGGSYIDRSLKPVPQTYAWASNVLRFSSQYSQCGPDCYEWRKPSCTSNDVLAGGWETGTCSTTGWHASSILGEPDVYPAYLDNKNSWDLSEENEGHEWIELEFPFPVYVSAFEVYETHKPGAIWKISTTDEYLDDINESCIRETCSTKTKWQTLWTKPRESVKSGPERATVFSPPLCPSTVKSNLVRFDLDTSRSIGWNGYDAAKVTGSLEAPPGLVKDPENRLVYVPLTGVHGVDRFAFSSSDCLGEGEPAIYTVSIEPPTEANDFVFYQEDVDLELDPGQVELTNLDLSSTLNKIQEALGREPTNMTGTLAFSDSLGNNDETFTNISLNNPLVPVELGAEARGAPFSHIDLWLEQNYLSSNMTFRVRYWIRLRLACVNGIEDVDSGICICTSSSWTGELCSEEVDDESNLLLFIILPVAGVIILLLIIYLIYERRQRKNDSMWQVDKKELIFPDPPQVIGRGTFGVVLLAEFRGTQVAVKRVIPPKSEKSKDERLDGNNSNDGLTQQTSGMNSGLGMASGMRSSLNFGMGLGLRSSIGSSEGAKGRMSLVSGSGNVMSDAAQFRKLKNDFIEEMRHLSKLRHPSVTTIMGAVLGKDPMLVMEYMDHGSLYDILHNETMLIEGELLIPILRDISQGMRFLHSSGIIHGDLKAANILVDSKFRAKVADFGLSQKQALGGTGTPFWMAPELLRKESSNTPATDVYSFGIILYEVYSRRDPYEDEDPIEVLTLVADKNVKKRPPVPRHMPENMSTLMADCVNEDPENRPTFEELDVRVKRMDVKSLDAGQAKTSSVSLFDIFPRHIAEALRDGRTVDPEHKDSVTLFFSDIVGFTDISSTLEPRKIAGLLDRLYTRFDALSQQHDVFKVETIGDAYMAVTNLVKDQSEDHARRIAEFAIDAIAAANETIIDPEQPEKGYVNIRVGFHSGPVVADVVGTRSPRYCLFGDTVNTASRMESNSKTNRIHCSKEAAKLLRKQCPDLPLQSRGKIKVKGKGILHTFWVNEGGQTRRPSKVRRSDVEKPFESCVGGPLDAVADDSGRHDLECFSDEFSAPGSGAFSSAHLTASGPMSTPFSASISGPFDASVTRFHADNDEPTERTDNKEAEPEQALHPEYQGELWV